jgi:hypothetical protein
VWQLSILVSATAHIWRSFRSQIVLRFEFFQKGSGVQNPHLLGYLRPPFPAACLAFFEFLRQATQLAGDLAWPSVRSYRGQEVTYVFATTNSSETPQIQGQRGLTLFACRAGVKYDQPVPVLGASAVGTHVETYSATVVTHPLVDVNNRVVSKNSNHG